MRSKKIDKIEYDPVSIVIPVLNNLDWTKQCLESLFQRSGNRDFEVIVIDNASTDATAQYLEEFRKTHPQLVVVQNEKNIGVAPAWNLGIKLAKHDYVCIINNDIKILSDDWLFEMQKTLKTHKNTLWTSPRTCYSLDPKKISYKPSHYEQLVYGSSSDEYVVACCFMCPKITFDEVGLFDEKFEVKYYEDLDFIARILSLGKRVKMCHACLVYHGVGKTSRITSGGDNNENYYQSKWGNTKFDILAMQPGRGVKGVKKFIANE